MIKWGNGEITNVGCVVRTWEHNGSWDSDFYATVINPDNGTIEEVEYDTTRFAGTGAEADIDLTEDNYRKYLRNAFRRQLNYEIANDQYISREITVGKEVKVVRGRKVPIGTNGTVFYRNEVNYDPYGRLNGREVRLGIKDKDGNVHWTYERNVEIVDATQYRKSAKDLLKELKSKRSRWYLSYKEHFGWA